MKKLFNKTDVLKIKISMLKRSIKTKRTIVAGLNVLQQQHADTIKAMYQDIAEQQRELKDLSKRLKRLVDNRNK